MGVYRYKQKQGDARSFAQRRRAADKRESASGLRNRSFFFGPPSTTTGRQLNQPNEVFFTFGASKNRQAKENPAKGRVSRLLVGRVS
jgi:hypothetical protein